MDKHNTYIIVYLLIKRNFVSRVMWTQGDPVSSSDTCMIKGTSSGVNDN